MKIKARDGSVIDLEDIRKEQVFIGNPYAVDHAILIKHNIALLDALEAALSVPRRECNPDDPNVRDQDYICIGHDIAREAAWEAAGVINAQGEPCLPGELS